MQFCLPLKKLLNMLIPRWTQNQLLIYINNSFAPIYIKLKRGTVKVQVLSPRIPLVKVLINEQYQNYWEFCKLIQCLTKQKTFSIITHKHIKLYEVFPSCMLTYQSSVKQVFQQSLIIQGISRLTSYTILRGGVRRFFQIMHFLFT